MSPSPSVSSRLDIEDFRRLGVRPNECRLAVIRLAATRRTRALAAHQLKSPSQQAGLRLSQVATSTYRLLDPRLRRSGLQRAHVGRIQPVILQGAAPTYFRAQSKSSGGSDDDRYVPDQMSDAQLIELLELDTAPMVSGQPAWTLSLKDEDLLKSTPSSRRWQRITRRLLRPGNGVAAAILIVLAAVWMYRRDRTIDPGPDQSPFSLQTSTASADKINSVATVDSVDVESTLTQEPTSTQENDPLTDLSNQLASGQADDPGSPPLGMIVADQPTDRSTLAPTPGQSAELDAEFVEFGVKPGAPLAISERSDLEVAADANVDAGETLMAAANDIDRTDGTDEFLPDPFAAILGDPAAVAVASDSERVGDGADDDSRLQSQQMMQEVSQVKPLAVPVPAALAEVKAIAAREALAIFPVPTAVEIESVRRRLVKLIPELGNPALAADRSSLIDQLQRISDDLEVGSAEHWAAQTIIIELAWFDESVWDIRRRFADWIGDYRTVVESHLAATFATAIGEARSQRHREHFLRSGLVLAEQLVLSESHEFSADVVLSAQRTARDLGDDQSIDYCDQFSEALAQMRRQSESVRRFRNDSSGANLDSADAGIAGRYYCLMLRRWQFGLPWLAETTDPRVASLAAAELELSVDEPAAAVVEMAARWLAQASRESGRTSDSMRLHAIDLMLRVADDLSVLEKLRVERTIEEAQRQLPFFATSALAEAALDRL